MPKSDDGHFELVLGNRQLISGFFVLVILFAIFLTLGYILGRNSVVIGQNPELAEGGARESREGNGGAISQASAAQPARQRPEPSEKPSPATSPAAMASAIVPEQAETRPRAEAMKPAATVPPPAAKPQPPAQKSGAEPDVRSGVRVITPRKGDTFIQVAAIDRPEAELMAERLNKLGHRAFISEVPGKDLFRVLIGPFQTADRLSATKKQLESEGLPTIVQRY